MADQETTVAFAVGDHVRLKNRDINEHPSYQIKNAEVAFTREPADGIVLSIREIKSGRLVTQATGNIDQYVVELLYDNTFNPRYASTRNAPRTAERATAAPAWRRIHAMLRDLAAKGELISTNTPNFLTESPLAKYLDGWKVLKVRSNDIVSLEKEKPAQETASA